MTFQLEFLLTTLAIAVIGVFFLGVLRKIKNDSARKLQDQDLGLSKFMNELSNWRQQLETTQESRLNQLRTDITHSLHTTKSDLQQGYTHSSQEITGRVQQLDGQIHQHLLSMTGQLHQKMEQNIKDGFQHFIKVSEHLANTEKQLVKLHEVGESIHDLNRLLKLPHLRGSFGESLLESLLNDALPRDSYELQYMISGESTERVDAVIKFPSGLLPVDSKFPKESVAQLFEAKDKAELEQARRTLSDVIKTQAKSIRNKYIRPDCGTLDMALLFIPSESIYFELIRDIKLMDDLRAMKIFPASPHTFLVMLQSIASARHYYLLAQGMEQTIINIKKSQKHFEQFEIRFHEITHHLQKSIEAHQIATTHLGRYNSSIQRITGVDAAVEASGVEGTA